MTDAATVVHADLGEAGKSIQGESSNPSDTSSSVNGVVKLATLLLPARNDSERSGAEWSATDAVETVACQKRTSGNGANCVRITIARTTRLRRLNKLMLYRRSLHRRHPLTPGIHGLCVERKGLVSLQDRHTGDHDGSQLSVEPLDTNTATATVVTAVDWPASLLMQEQDLPSILLSVSRHDEGRDELGGGKGCLMKTYNNH